MKEEKEEWHAFLRLLSYFALLFRGKFDFFLKIGRVVLFARYI